MSGWQLFSLGLQTACCLCARAREAERKFRAVLEAVDIFETRQRRNKLPATKWRKRVAVAVSVAVGVAI